MAPLELFLVKLNFPVSDTLLFSQGEENFDDNSKLDILSDLKAFEAHFRTW
jgi:hypothetical protein